MATTTDEIGRIGIVEIKYPKKTPECSAEESKLLNGKVENQTNGHIKTKHLINGVTKPLGDGLPPPMDWSEYETDLGSFEKSTLWTAVLTHLGLYILMFLGFVNQMLFKPKVAIEKNREGYAPLYNPFEVFFSRYVYRRVRHCFNRPICSAPTPEITIMERHSDDYNWSFRFTGRKLKCINLGSYNYLGLAAAEEATAEVTAAVRQYGLTLASTRAELGSTPLHDELEASVARFLGVEDAIVLGMGFATNALSLPGLVGPGTLALSDENNHASLILGLRLARASVRVFKHNDLRHLERLARAARKEGTWRRIIIVVEGVYSMEGSIVPLRGMVALKKRLGLQLYLDEAHSIGAMGSHGRGVTDHCGVSPKDIDVLMGTFTKSFGAAGGYIAGSIVPLRGMVALKKRLGLQLYLDEAHSIGAMGSHGRGVTDHCGVSPKEIDVLIGSSQLINQIRLAGHAHAYAVSMAPCVAAQILWALKAIDSKAGAARVAQLKENTAYFRRRLREMGVVVFGSEASPVVPMVVYSFSKMAATVERLAEMGVAAVGVGFPATPLNKARIRFCLSATLSRAQLDACLAAIARTVHDLGLRYSRLPLPSAPAPAPPPPPPPHRC